VPLAQRAVADLHEVFYSEAVKFVVWLLSLVLNIIVPTHDVYVCVDNRSYEDLHYTELCITRRLMPETGRCIEIDFKGNVIWGPAN